ncbi:MAG: universal stress protein [Planctomycetes bacterium]|nr:universal stress protein [Planctomycetota bacterium]
MSFLPRRRVVAPVDFSDRSVEVVKTARDIAGVQGQVLVVHVLPELSPTDPGVIWETIDDSSRIEKAGRTLRDTYPADDPSKTRFEVVVGDPGHEVAAIAERTSADLIVVASHGRTGVKRLLIGSVAERIVRLAHCPVLVLRS